MNKFLIAICLLLVTLFFASIISAQEAEAENSDVLTLTTQNFESTLTSIPLVLVEFYAPWCGHCKKLAPEYEKAATALKGIQGVAIAKVDSTVEQDLARKFGVRGYPTIKLFRDGKFSADYKSDRNAEAIVAYMKKNARPAPALISTEEEAEAFIKESSIYALAFFSIQDEALATNFASTAQRLRELLPLGKVINPELFAKFGVSTTPLIKLYKAGGEVREYTDSNGEKLASWIVANMYPLVDQIASHNSRLYAEAGVPMLAILSNPTDENAALYRQAMIDAAEEFRGQLYFTYTDTENAKNTVTSFGFTDANIPAVIIDTFARKQRFVLPTGTPITAENIASFARDFLAEKLTPYLKSEPIPENQADEDGLVTLVAKTFTSVALDSSKDVLVEFYAPWCGHCKKLAPIYSELAKSLKSVSSLVIAKMDATANDLAAGVDVRGFPTIKLFRAGNKSQPIDFRGDRSVEGFTNWLKENVDHKFNLSQPEPVAEEQPKPITRDEL